MKIGVDIDGVVADSSKKFLEFYNKKTNSKLLIKDWVTYNFWDFVSMPKEEGKKLLEEFYSLNDFDEIPLIEGSREAIIKLSKSNEVYIITARPLQWRDKTKKFLDKYFCGEEISLIHSRDNTDKAIYKREICNNLKIDVLIEDHGDIALQCAEIGVKVFLLDHPYNKNCEHKNITRVNSWDEILRRLGEGRKRQNEYN